MPAEPARRPPLEKALPLALLDKLRARGYEVESPAQPLDIGAEKFVFGASRAEIGAASAGVVLLYSKKVGDGRFAWNFERELEVFQELAGHEHPHIIQMLDFLRHAEDRSHGPCMVLERVDPLGFDVFKVVKQYQGARQRTLPVAQWMHYLGQLIEAVEHLHGRGWAHCDLKPDNVMIKEGHDLKVIDFSFARRIGSEPGPPRWAAYMPPEFRDMPQAAVQPSADLWLIGSMMFVVFAQMQVAFPTEDGRMFEVTNHPDARKHGVTAAVQKWWNKRVDRGVGMAINNLLRRDPGERWTLQRLRAWWQSAKGDVRFGELLPIPPERHTPEPQRFRQAPPLDRLVKAFGYEVSEGSELIGKYIGSHTTPEGERIEGKDKALDLRHDAGAEVLFIDRGATELVKFPGARDQVQCGDWLYFLLQEERHETETEEQREFRRKEQEARSVGVEICLEFDWFELPTHCTGATVGELSIGELFHINVHFVARSEEHGGSLVEVGRDTLLLLGDQALVCRVPDRQTGRSCSIISDDLLDPLLDEAEFRSRLGLEDDQRYRAWREECVSRTRGDRGDDPQHAS